MGQVLIEIDNRLKKSDIVIPLMSSTPEEAGYSYKKNQSDKQQSSVYGIQVPLIEINNIVIDFNNIVKFSLKSESELPFISISVIDKYNLIATLDTPNSDNELRIQILPQFENAYKKINLTFYITGIEIKNNIINLTGKYKLPELLKSIYKSYGKINTYDLFKNIAEDTKLGFATNIKSNDQDLRYVYCDNKSYLDIMNKEISYAGNEREIYDWWIDFWDNINLVDMYERYNSVDSDKDLQIWVANNKTEIIADNTSSPIKVPAVLNNLPINSSNELFVKRYIISNKSGKHMIGGTDKVYTIYNYNDRTLNDTLIQDGDIKHDIFTKYEYLGEVYGDYDYMKQKYCRKSYLQKINAESVKVVLNSPLLALMRGHKVNFMWYRVDTFLEFKSKGLKKENIINSSSPHIPLDSYDVSKEKPESHYILDEKISGQYLITGCDMEFINNKWEYIITLNRPAAADNKLLNDKK